MLGRGIVADPGLALAIKRQGMTMPGAADPGGSPEAGLDWQALLPLVADFWRIVGTQIAPHHRSGRLKQWLNFLRRRYPEAQAAYEAVRTISDPALVSQRLFGDSKLDVPRMARLAA
jgi:tRNA-dihydrouridine synthase C